MTHYIIIKQNQKNGAKPIILSKAQSSNILSTFKQNC